MKFIRNALILMTTIAPAVPISAFAADDKPASGGNGMEKRMQEDAKAKRHEHSEPKKQQGAAPTPGAKSDAKKHDHDHQKDHK